MAALFKQYFNIAFLMGKPQDLPAGENQLYIALACNFVTYVLALLSFTGFGSAVLHAAIDLGCTGLFLYVALMLVKRLPRFEQAYGAICGAGAVLNLIAIPLLLLTSDPQGEAAIYLAFFARFLLLVWSLSLVGHVLRHTFSLHMVLSVSIAVVYYILITNLLGQVFPDQSGADEAAMLFPAIEYIVSIG